MGNEGLVEKFLMKKSNLSNPLVVAATVIASLLLYSVCMLSAQSQQPAGANAPSDQDIRLEQAWRLASSKYDAQRTALNHQVDEGIKTGPFRADWDSLAKYKVPAWFEDAKFGIFIHWGVYSVPAFGNEWYPRHMYEPGTKENEHQLATFGPLSQFGYKDFIPRFKAEHFDPRAWASLFHDSGAKYVVPVFEHHDGFAMYDSGLSDWTAAKMGPHRDVAGELVAAVRAQGLHVGASSHRIEHDWFMGYTQQGDTDGSNGHQADFYGPAHNAVDDHHATAIGMQAYLSAEFSSDWLARSTEIVTKYHPEVMWFDWWIGNPVLEPYLRRFTAFYYNESLKHGGVGVLNYKNGAMPAHTAVLDIERGQLSDIRPEYWQTDTSVSNKSWGYIEGDTFKTPLFIVQQLVDIVSKNGNLLLNVGPRSDGTIPDEVQKILREVGTWLHVNGEAIYGTRPWKQFGEGPTKVVEGAFHDTDTQSYTAEDFRFTSKGKTLYAIELASPSGKETVIRSLKLSSGTTVKSVTLLDSRAGLHFTQRSDGLHIDLPTQPPSNYAYVFRIDLHR
jgi:alpha-L-fucosidase